MECQNKDLIPHGLRITHELHAFLQSENLQEDWKKSTKALERHFLKLLNKNYSDTLEEITTELSRIEEEEKLTEDCTIERVLCQHTEITDENGKKLSSPREGMENKRRKKIAALKEGSEKPTREPQRRTNYSNHTHRKVEQKRALPTEKRHSRGYPQLQQRQPAARRDSQTCFRNPKHFRGQKPNIRFRSNPTRAHKNPQKELSIKRALSELLLKVLTTEDTHRDKNGKGKWKQQKNTLSTFPPRY